MPFCLKASTSLTEPVNHSKDAAELCACSIPAGRWGNNEPRAAQPLANPVCVLGSGDLCGESFSSQTFRGSVCKSQSQGAATGRRGPPNTAPPLRVWVHVPVIISLTKNIDLFEPQLVLFFVPFLPML